MFSQQGSYVLLSSPIAELENRFLWAWIGSALTGLELSVVFLFDSSLEARTERMLFRFFSGKNRLRFPEKYKSSRVKIELKQNANPPGENLSIIGFPGTILTRFSCMGCSGLCSDRSFYVRFLGFDPI